MLTVNLSDRWSASRCFAHPYFDEHREECSVTTCSELFEDLTMDFVNNVSMPLPSCVKKLGQYLGTRSALFQPFSAVFAVLYLFHEVVAQIDKEVEELPVTFQLPFYNFQMLPM